MDDPSRKRILGDRLAAIGVARLCLVVVLTGCSSAATPYRSAMERAEEARRKGHFSDERRHFDDAARMAKKPSDASEARYRSAQTWVRAGEFETGAQRLQEFASTYPASTRAARAWLDSGRAWERARIFEKAVVAYKVVVSKYPDSGGSLSAARRLVALGGELRSRPAHEEWRRLLGLNSSGEFDEALRYHYARSLEDVSKRLALLAYEDVAQKHPLPRASYADEALFRAAQLRRELRDPKGALETLEVLLSQGGPAAIVGSYTRTSYVEALILKGIILRDDLKRPSAALKTFESLPEKHAASRLVDDAIWESVRTEHSLGVDPCARFHQLRRLRPESRYLRCEPLLCAEKITDARHAQTCREWLSASD